MNTLYFMTVMPSFPHQQTLDEWNKSKGRKDAIWKETDMNAQRGRCPCQPTKQTGDFDQNDRESVRAGEHTEECMVWIHQMPLSIPFFCSRQLSLPLPSTAKAWLPLDCILQCSCQVFQVPALTSGTGQGDSGTKRGPSWETSEDRILLPSPKGIRVAEPLGQEESEFLHAQHLCPCAKPRASFISDILELGGDF